jgi:nucleotide-binding universal stress UspA family protein
MSVAEPLWFAGAGEPPIPVIINPDELKAGLHKRLEGALVKELRTVPVERVAELGDPAGVITEFAEANGVDLIMMPTHGYGPFRRLLLGSVTAKVLHDAKCPVWTGAHLEDAPALDPRNCRSVLCAVDTTPTSAPLMRWAADYAKDARATLRLVHAVSGVEAWPERQLDREFEEALRNDARTKIEQMQRAEGVETQLCVCVGGVADVVREEARRHAADLVVIGRGVLHETLGRLRTHSYGIIRQSPCPVISV